LQFYDILAIIITALYILYTPFLFIFNHDCPTEKLGVLGRYIPIGIGMYMCVDYMLLTDIDMGEFIYEKHK